MTFNVAVHILYLQMEEFLQVEKQMYVLKEEIHGQIQQT